jgi:hypothetical protein
MTGIDIQKTGLERNCCIESIQKMLKLIETPRNNGRRHSKPKRATNGFAKESIRMFRAVEYIGREIGRYDASGQECYRCDHGQRTWAATTRGRPTMAKAVRTCFHGMMRQQIYRCDHVEPLFAYTSSGGIYNNESGKGSSVSRYDARECYRCDHEQSFLADTTSGETNERRVW